MTHEELHLGNLLVNLLLELNDKVDKLVLQHLFGVEVCYQEGNVIALCRDPRLAHGLDSCQVDLARAKSFVQPTTHGNGFSPQNEE